MKRIILIFLLACVMLGVFFIPCIFGDETFMDNLIIVGIALGIAGAIVGLVFLIVDEFM